MINKDMVNLLDYNLEDLKAYFVSIGDKAFRAQQVFKWVHQSLETDFANMSNISKNLRAYLQEHAYISAPPVSLESVATDGTIKWLLEVPGGSKIETVFIPERTRGTLCVSSQVGCALNCQFCFTATQGFNRNLSVSEIIGQVWFAAKRLREMGNDQKITNVVMMGMGEPLMNFDNVVKAMSIMRDELAYALPRRRVTLSTSGVVPKMYELSDKADVALAVSLHAPNDKIRDVIVPINKKYPIKELLAACRHYASSRHKFKITMEYVMLDGVNDSKDNAIELAKILSNVPCKVNLIPFNPYPGANYDTTPWEKIEQFRNILINKGLVTTIRRTRGDDILAACGQLAGNVKDKTKRQERYKKHLMLKPVLVDNIQLNK